MKFAAILSIMALSGYSAFGQILSEHHWSDRVILLFASDSEQAELQTQIGLLTRDEEEVTERALVIYQIFDSYALSPNKKVLTSADAKTLRDSYDIPSEEAFTFILIGKDGTEKMRSEKVVSMSTLFSIIDAMPMRRAEIRKKGQ
jgi:hypothetical protein